MNVPELLSDYPLTEDQCADFQRNGFTLLRGVCTPAEAAAFQPLLRDVTLANNHNTKPMEERDTYAKAFIQVGNLWLRDERAAKFSLSRRFAKIAAELLGVDGVRLYHDQALYKEPGGGHTPWHQDQQYWPLDGAQCCTLWMPLVDCSADMGTMTFATGSQTLGYLGPQNISDESEARWNAFVKERGFTVENVGDMLAGDATFHNGWTLHGAPGNASKSQTREVMTVIYVEDGARITEPDSPQREGDLAGCFPGLKPGDLAASAINPLLYHKEHKP